MDLIARQAIVDSLETGVVLLDDDLHIGYLNPAAETLLGVSAKRVHGKRFEELVSCEGTGLQERLYAYLLVGRPYTERELYLTLPDHRTIMVDCTVTPVFDGELAPAALLELRQVDQHVRISRDARHITEHHAARQMIRGLAHEIKNPLGGLRGAAQLLGDELDDTSLQEYTRVIIEEADRLQTLVDRLLGPKTRPRLRQVDIHEVLERVRTLLRSEAPGEIRLKRDYDPSIPSFSADADLLIQATLNIARNALQALGESGTITFKTRVLNKFTVGNVCQSLVVKADIIDDGPGIPDELQDRVFYPMVTGRSDGTGLGLSIAQMVINQHHGLIEFNSRPGRTVFSILLPLSGTQRE